MFSGAYGDARMPNCLTDTAPPCPGSPHRVCVLTFNNNNNNNNIVFNFRNRNTTKKSGKRSFLGRNWKHRL